MIKAKILTKIVISLHEVKSEWFSQIFSLLSHYLNKLIWLVYTNSWLLVLTLKSWFYCCMQPTNIADIYFHSLWQNPLHKGNKGKKTPYYCFHRSKISSMTCDWSDAHFSLVRKTIWPIRICAVFYKSIFFSNLAWRKSQYVFFFVHFPMEGHISPHVYTHISKNLVLVKLYLFLNKQQK